MAWEQMLKGFFCKGDINRDRTLAHVEDLSRDVMVVLNIGKNLTERFFRNFFQLTGQDPSPPILICCDDIEEWNDSLEAYVANSLPCIGTLLIYADFLACGRLILPMSDCILF